MNKEQKKCFIIFQRSSCFVCTELSQSQKWRHKKCNPDVVLNKSVYDHVKHDEVFCNKGVLRNFTKFTEKFPPLLAASAILQK